MKPRYIQFLGKEMPVYFGFNASNLLERKRATQDLNDLENTAVMVQIALSEGARKEGIKNAPKLTMEQIFDGLDEAGVDGMKQITDAIAAFLPKGDTEEGEKEPGEGIAPAVQ